MKITVCIGSACHIKGSRNIVETFHDLITKHELSDKVELGGTFCMGNCQQGVCVMIDQDTFSVTPDDAESFFNQNVLVKFQ